MRLRLPGVVTAALVLAGVVSPAQASGLGDGLGRRPNGIAEGFGQHRGRRTPGRAPAPLRAQPAPVGRRDPTANSPATDARPDGLSALVSDIFDRTGLLDAVLQLRQTSRTHWFPVFCYHRVGRPGPDYGFDPDVIDATPEQFDAQISVVRRYFQPIGPDDVLAHIEGRRALPRNPAMVTFDDGYRDNFTQALPILERYGVPATFFLATRYLTERRIYWWDRIHYLFRNSAVARAELDYPTRLTLDPARDRSGSLRTVVGIVKNVHRLDLDRFLDQLAVALQVPWSQALEQQLADDLILTWDDVRAMQRRGMHFGSHTRSHRILHTLSNRELDGELAGSRDDLRRELGTAPSAIAYPGGLPVSGLGNVVRAVESAGYRLGFTNGTGANSMLDTPEPFGLRRLALDRDTTLARFRGMLAFPQLFAPGGAA